MLGLDDMRFEVRFQCGQSLAQMALAWILRDPRVTSALVGASSVEQLDDSLGALENLAFEPDTVVVLYGDLGAVGTLARTWQDGLSLPAGMSLLHLLTDDGGL